MHYKSQLRNCKKKNYISRCEKSKNYNFVKTIVINIVKSHHGIVTLKRLFCTHSPNNLLCPLKNCQRVYLSYFYLSPLEFKSLASYFATTGNNFIDLNPIRCFFVERKNSSQLYKCPVVAQEPKVHRDYFESSWHRHKNENCRLKKNWTMHIFKIAHLHSLACLPPILLLLFFFLQQ